MARLPNQNTTPGRPAKPPGMTKAVETEWFRLLKDLAESNIAVSKAHGRLIELAARMAVDIEDAEGVVKQKGAYYTNPKTGAVMMHPAARRMEGLRRDYVKVLSLLGLRSAVGSPPEKGKSLDDLLDED